MLVLFLYRILCYLFTPVFIVLLLIRVLKGKEDKKRFLEKLGISKVSRPEGKLVWMNVASIGELRAASSLFEKFKKDGYNILLTSVTLSSSKIAAKQFSNAVIHQFTPLDHPYFIKRFLKKWQPDLGVFIESELWPNLIELSSHKLPLSLINARMSPSSFLRWKKYKQIFRFLLNKFSLIIPASDTDKNYLSYFLNKTILLNYNLKYSAPKLIFPEEELADLEIALTDKITLVFASIHPEEVNIFISAYHELYQKFKEVVAIIVPRHPKNSELIESACKSFKLKYKVRSQGESLSSDQQVYIVDTIGEMGLFYQVGDIIIMGGSFINHGGQNPIEPAHFKKPIVIGSSYHNFKQIVEDMLNKKAVKTVKSKYELASTLESLIKNQPLRKQIGNNAFYYVSSKANQLEHIYTIIKSFIKDPVSKC